MPPPSADPSTIQTIRRLASKPDDVAFNKTVYWDLVGRDMKIHDICDTIVEWIDRGERVKPTVLARYAGREGQPAYEFMPRIDGVLWYIKVVIDDIGTPSEAMTVLSAHPNH